LSFQYIVVFPKDFMGTAESVNEDFDVGGIVEFVAGIEAEGVLCLIGQSIYISYHSSCDYPGYDGMFH